MLSLPAPLASHYAQPLTTTARLWSITLKSGQVLRYTDHDRDLTVAGNLFSSATAPFSASSVSSSAGLNVDNLECEVAGLPASERAAIDAGVYDGATVLFEEVDWSNPAGGTRIVKTGELGNISYSSAPDGGAVRLKIEFLSLAQKLARQMHQVTSPTCRAALGDARCKVNLAPLTYTGSVTAVASRSAFTDSALASAAGTHTFGLVTWLTGANAGLQSEVKSHAAGGVLTLQTAAPYAVAVGDAYSVIPGCDKTRTTCVNRYNNMVNFRGEPDIPGADAILRVGGQ